jgi:hypothetical protein
MRLTKLSRRRWRSIPNLFPSKMMNCRITKSLFKRMRFSLIQRERKFMIQLASFRRPLLLQELVDNLWPRCLVKSKEQSGRKMFFILSNWLLRNFILVPRGELAWLEIDYTKLITNKRNARKKLSLNALLDLARLKVKSIDSSMNLMKTLDKLQVISSLKLRNKSTHYSSDREQTCCTQSGSQSKNLSAVLISIWNHLVVKWSVSNRQLMMCWLMMR